MKLRTVLSTALATAAAALGVGAVAALAQDEDPQRPAPQGQHDDHGSMLGDHDGAMMRTMQRHHAGMLREMREIDPEMARMTDRHHKEMMGKMHEGGMDGMDRE